ncbi:hypothetical protein [Pedobacter faecalis]|uniref:hypothetical protein n=1 Tax=Pedobacter faecalis TaxID=3041495 RepID=UPI0025513B25|nr:hypothetical protein [Pedobacter sp. ELA7]
MPNQDVIDRKGAWFERMFDRLFLAIKENPYGTIAIVSVLINVWLLNIIIEGYQDRLNDNRASKDEMISEVRNSVRREIPKQMEPIKAKQDSISKSVDTTLLNINGTVESVKEYFNKNKRK